MAKRKKPGPIDNLLARAEAQAREEGAPPAAATPKARRSRRTVTPPADEAPALGRRFDTPAAAGPFPLRHAFALASLSGALGVLTQPVSFPLVTDTPGGNVIFEGPWQPWLALIALVPLFNAIRGRSAGAAFALGTWAGFVYFLWGIFWINVAMIVFGGLPWWLALIGESLLVLLLAAHWGAAAAVAVALARRRGGALLWWAPLSFAGFEYVRNYIFSGFPWSALGYSQLESPLVAQSAALWGVYGLSLLTAGAGAVAVLAIDALRALAGRAPWHGPLDAVERRRLWTRFVPTVAALWLVAFAWGAYRLRDAYPPDPTKSLRIAAIQGAIDQATKNRREAAAGEVLGVYRDLTAQAAKEGVALAVWPEAATGRLVPRDAVNLSRALDYDHGEGPRIPVFVGAPAYTAGEDDLVLSNSGFLIDGAANVRTRYDKSHLVPFGEFVPEFMTWFGLRRLVPGSGRMRPGEHVVPVPFEPAHFGPLICYEGIFPEIARRHVLSGARLLVNITNDAWYGVSPGPYQHLNMYRMRSIETGRYTVRAANTGVSAFVDPWGRVTSRLELKKRGVLYGVVEPRDEITPYARVGDIAGWGALVWLAVAFVRRRRGEERPAGAG